MQLVVRAPHVLVLRGRVAILQCDASRGASQRKRGAPVSQFSCRSCCTGCKKDTDHAGSLSSLPCLNPPRRVSFHIFVSVTSLVAPINAESTQPINPTHLSTYLEEYRQKWNVTTPDGEGGPTKFHPSAVCH